MGGIIEILEYNLLNSKWRSYQMKFIDCLEETINIIGFELTFCKICNNILSY
jgi:hypothetical protein